MDRAAALKCDGYQFETLQVEYSDRGSVHWGQAGTLGVYFCFNMS